MFGLVSASVPELTREEKQRYNSIYCGICREIRQSCSRRARLVLSYDMTFLALLLMSLYEPEETAGSRACGLHPIKLRPWVDNEYIRRTTERPLPRSWRSICRHSCPPWRGNTPGSAERFANVSGS